MGNENNNQQEKGKFLKIRKDIGHFISETPLFKALKDKATLYFHNPEQLQAEITGFYNEATNEHGRKTIADMWVKLKNLYNMVADAIQNKYTEIPKAKLVIGIAVILYVLMPADIVPDVLPVFGFTDDFALLAWFMKNAAKEIHNYEIWRSTHISPVDYAGQTY